MINEVDSSATSLRVSALPNQLDVYAVYRLLSHCANGMLSELKKLFHWHTKATRQVQSQLVSISLR